MENLLYGWALDFIDSPADNLEFRFWSGPGQLTLDGITYEGTNGVIDLNPPNESQGNSVRMVARMDATIPEVREQLLYDIGPLKIRVKWIYSTDGGDTWALTGKEFIGRLSAPQLKGAEYVVDIESMISDIDRGRVINWSDDMHKSRYPDDKGMEYLDKYANGITTKWPPI